MKILLGFSLLLLAPLCFSQKKQKDISPFVKFGKVTAEDLQKKIYSIDSGANAVVLSDIGNAAIEGNSKGWFSLVTKRHTVVHILTKNGYDEAKFEIPLYMNVEDQEKVTTLKAVTYNLEGGKVVETKLERSGIFNEKVSKNKMVQKFTMPNVKEGSIVEVEYTVVSDFIWNMDPWLFQGEVPVLWSEFNFAIPEFYTYNFLGRGYRNMDINEREDHKMDFLIRESRGAGPIESYGFSAGITDYRWVMKNVPKIKEESFTSTVENHRSRIEFQLAAQRDPLQYRDYRSNWVSLTKSLLQSEYFGANLSTNNGWMKDEAQPVFASSNNNLERAVRIYSFVRNGFACTGNSGTVYMGQKLKDVFKNRKGSVAEINLLLVAMLRQAGLTANPVILSTRNHGYVMETSPIVSAFNYVVVQLVEGDKQYFLDASNPFLGFNKLHYQCYNGAARIISEDGGVVRFAADSLQESSLTQMFIVNDEKGKWIGSMKQTKGNQGSYDLRKQIKEKGKEKLFKDLEKEMGADLSIESPEVDSLTQMEAPVQLRYNFTLNNAGEDILYINPMFGEGYRKNPFTAAERSYPVEMPFTMDETVILSMEIPKGYTVDELPKQALVKYDEEGKSFFEYRITNNGGMISFRSRIRINRALFMPDEYEILRDFFTFVVNKQNEQIVFKKIK